MASLIKAGLDAKSMLNAFMGLFLVDASGEAFDCF